MEKNSPDSPPADQQKIPADSQQEARPGRKVDHDVPGAMPKITRRAAL